MASTYTSDLKIELIGTGDQAGSWGSTTNENWSRVDEAISSYAELPTTYSSNTRSWVLDDTTNAFTDASVSSTGSTGRAAFVEFTDSGGTRGADLAVTIQGSSGNYPRRVFFARNSLSGGYDIVFDAGGNLDSEKFTLKNGATAIIYTKLAAASADNIVANLLSTVQIDKALVGTGAAAGTVTTNGAQNLVLNTNEGTNSGSIVITDAANGDINVDPNGTGDINLFSGGGSGALTLDSNNISGVNTLTATSLAGTLTTAVQTNITSIGTLGTLQVDNININANTISSTDTGGHVLIEPNGGGNVELRTDTVDIGTNTENKFITTSGTGDFTLSTNGGTDSGSIKIFDGVNGTIDIVPNGTGNIRMFQGGGTGSLTLNDQSILNVGDINCDSVSVDDGAVGLNIDFRGADDGVSKISVQDGHAEALIFENSTGADLIVINTESSNSITVAPATTFSETITGSITGSAGSATSATNATNATKVTVTDNESTAEENLIAFVADAATSTGNHGLEMDGNLTYKPSTGALTSTSFIGNLAGTANIATYVATTADGSNADYRITFISDGGGNTSIRYDVNDLTYNPNTNTLSVGTISTTNVGNITGGSWDAPIHGTGGAGNNNISIGANTGANLTTGGNENVLFGDEAGNDVTTGDGNVLIGYEAGHKLTTSNDNIAIGRGALPLFNGSSGSNIAIGSGALPDLGSSGNQNIAIGDSSGDVVTTGARNITIGSQSNCSSTSSTDEIVIGYNVTGVANKVCLGKSGNVLSADYTGEGTTTWSATSDINIKKNIEPETIGLSLINKLNPVQFNFKGVDDLSDEEDVYVDYVSSKSSKKFHGFIAQEVEEAAQSVGIESLDGLYVDAKGVYQFGATAFIQPMVKAIQELSSKIDSLESRLAALE
tara:strand:+ start:1160 stop:3844 length:2685 start_codon:yes stop_codon:yes gene_type:complete